MRLRVAPFRADKFILSRILPAESRLFHQNAACLRVRPQRAHALSRALDNQRPAFY